jgi:hypothetical protein
VPGDIQSGSHWTELKYNVGKLPIYVVITNEFFGFTLDFDEKRDQTIPVESSPELADCMRNEFGLSPGN